MEPSRRTSDQAAKASAALTSLPETSSTLSDVRSTRKTVKCPASVATVSTCQRRLRSEFVRSRKRTNDSPSQPTGFLRTSRLPPEMIRAAASPTRRARLGVLSAAAKAAIATTKMARPRYATVSSAV